MNTNFVIASVEGRVCICNEVNANENIRVVNVEISSDLAFELLQKRLENCKIQLRDAIEANRIIETRTCTINGKDYADILFVNSMTGYSHHYNQFTASIMEDAIKHEVTLSKLERKEVTLPGDTIFWIIDQYKKAIIFADLAEEVKSAYLEHLAYIKHAVYNCDHH